MDRSLAIDSAAAPGQGRFDRPTPPQRRTLRALGVAEASVRQAAYGPDLFAYVEDDFSTLRLQIAPDGHVVGQTVLNREPVRAHGREV